MVSWQSRVAERNDGQSSVPHWRLAGLDAPAGTRRGLIENGEPIPAGHAPGDDGMVDAIAIGVQRHQRVDPRRLDTAPGAVGLLALDDPGSHPAQRELAYPPQRVAVVAVQNRVQDGKSRGPATRPDPAGGTARSKVTKIESEIPAWAQSAQNRQRSDGLARPAGEVVQAERGAGWQQDLFRWHDWDVIPGVLTEQSQQEVGEDAGLFKPAERMHQLPSLDQMVCVGRIAGEAERDVRLDGWGKAWGAAEEVSPGTVGSLLAADPAGGLLPLLWGVDAEKQSKKQIFGVHGDVGFELAAPPALGILQLK